MQTRSLYSWNKNKQIQSTHQNLIVGYYVHQLNSFMESYKSETAKQIKSIKYHSPLKSFFLLDFKKYLSTETFDTEKDP